MKSQYSSKGLFGVPSVTMRYGQEIAADELWKQILDIENEEKRNKQIDILVDLLSIDCEKTGFFDKNNPVVINQLLGLGFVLDDNQVYYDFFKNLKDIKLQSLKEKLSFTEGAIIKKAIEKTLDNYYGKYKSGNKKLRTQYVKSEYDSQKDDFVFPSIKKQKEKGTGVCAEHASLAHNLWLLTGKKSYYVDAKETFFQSVGKEFEDDGHAFCIVEYGGKFRLFDADMGNFTILEGNPVEKLLKGEAINVSGRGVTNPGIYGGTAREKENI